MNSLNFWHSSNIYLASAVYIFGKCQKLQELSFFCYLQGLLYSVCHADAPFDIAGQYETGIFGLEFFDRFKTLSAADLILRYRFCMSGDVDHFRLDRFVISQHLIHHFFYKISYFLVSHFQGLCIVDAADKEGIEEPSFGGTALKTV